MKKTLYILCAIVASFVLAGCQKENNNEPAYVGPTHTLTFTAEKMVDTKTAIDSEDNGVVSYKWIEGDDERMEILELYEYDDNGTTKTKGTPGTITGMTITNNGKSATFTAEFSGDVPSTLIGYQAAYAGTFANSYNPKIPAEQSPLPTTFDPAADVLVSSVFNGGREATPFVFNMTRKVSVNKMTLKGLTAGEVISTVTFESNKQHAATYTMLSSGGYSGDGNKLTFTFTSNNTVPQNGEFPVYFTTAPVSDATFTVRVTTNAAVYEKTGANPISFAVGSVRRFGINLSGYRTPISAGTVYTLVESQSDLYDGANYLIVGSYDLNYKAMAAQRPNNRGADAVTVDTDASPYTITIDNSSEAHIFTIVDYGTDGYVFFDNNDNTYLYGNGASGNYLKSDADLNSSSYWDISINSSSKMATVTNKNEDNSAKPYLKYNQSGLFSCYGSSSSGTHFIYLYVDLSTATGAKQEPGLSFTTSSYTFELGDSNYSSFNGQVLTNPNSLTGITWTSDNTSLATVSGGTVSLVANATGTATITASFPGNDTYKAGSASYTITVNPAASVLGLPFTETFAECTGTMGWSGSVANGTFTPDHEDWVVANAYGADGAAKFGTTKLRGSAKTPSISYAGNATLTFKAGAWSSDSESTTLNLSVSSGDLYGDSALSTTITSVTLVKGAWTEYTVYLEDVESPFFVTFEGENAANSRFFLDDVSIVAGIVQPAASFGASMPNTDNVLAAGGTKTINVTGNVAWTASATNGASVSPSSGTGVGAVTVTIPENETSSEVTYSVTISTTADVDPDSHSFTITQDAAASVVNESTEADPYTPAEAVELAGQLSGGTLEDVYVYGIISGIASAFDSQFNNVSFDISIDGSSTGTEQFRIFRIGATSADDFKVGDAVEIKGTLTNYQGNTPEFTSGSSVLIAQVKKPTISPDGASFTNSQSVSISCATAGATIRYTTNGSSPTSSSTAYSGAITLTATATVKAIAIKGILTTGIASADFTKGSSAPSPETVTFSAQGYSNQQAITSYNGSQFTITFDKGTNSNAPKYYTSGTAIRAYGGNTFTIAAKNSHTISKIELTFGSSDGSNAITTNENTYSNGTWTGSASSVTFTIGGTSGNRRLSAIKVTYSN